MTDATSGRTGPRASFALRLVALLIDGVILGIASVVLRGVLGLFGSLLTLLLGLAYYAYFEGSPSGQTVGKRVMGIRVIRFEDGAPLGQNGAIVRALMKYVSGIPCALGYLWMLWDPQSQTWHDKVAASVVVPVGDYPVAAWPG
jgi:uncharacterized RDD family membrane protein YckC